MKTIRINDFLHHILNTVYTVHVIKYDDIIKLFTHELSYKSVHNLLSDLENYYGITYYNIESDIKNIYFCKSDFIFLNTQKIFKEYPWYYLCVNDEAIICFPKSIHNTVRYIYSLYDEIADYIAEVYPDSFPSFEKEYKSRFEKIVDELYDNKVYQFVHDVLGYNDIEIEVPKIKFILEEKAERRILSLCQAIRHTVDIHILYDKDYQFYIKKTHLDIRIEVRVEEKPILCIVDNKFVYEEDKIHELEKTCSFVYGLYNAFINRVLTYVKDLTKYARARHPLAVQIISSYLT